MGFIGLSLVTGEEIGTCKAELYTLGGTIRYRVSASDMSQRETRDGTCSSPIGKDEACDNDIKNRPRTRFVPTCTCILGQTGAPQHEVDQSG